MSEKESIESNVEETVMGTEKNVLSTEPVNAVEKSQTNENDTFGSNSVGSEKITGQTNADNSCAVDLMETSKNERTEEEKISNTAPENSLQTMPMETNSEGSTTNKQLETHSDDTIISADQILDSNSDCNEKSTEKVNSEPKMESENSGNNSKQQNVQVPVPIGSLALLNQYASSSEEEEDGSSNDDDSQDADSESESDNPDNSSNNKVIATQATDKDKELSSLAHSILDSVMSRDNYREASSER